MTPLMKQYHDIKQRYHDEIVLFQVGDFYEIFYDDAKRVAPFLGIVLTQRGMADDQPIPLCGFPRHTVDSYLIKLVRGGFRVVLCDQTSTAESGKMIERTVSQVITPGTLTDTQLLDATSASYLAILLPEADKVALLFIEVLTGKFFATTLLRKQTKLLEAELARFAPQEIVVPATAMGKEFKDFLVVRDYVVTVTAVQQLPAFDAWLMAITSAVTRTVVEHAPVLQQALQLAYTYLERNNQYVLQQMGQLELYAPEDFLILDAVTQRNLELVKNNHDGSREHTLVAVLDHAATSMGSRRIKQWLLRPLVNKQALELRQQAVQDLVNNTFLRSELYALLRMFGDVERCVGRIALHRAQFADYQQLLRAMGLMPDLCTLIARSDYSAGQKLLAEDYSGLRQLLVAALHDDPAREWRIKAGYNQELDRLRVLVDSGAQAVLNLEQREQEITGISSLKIRFNNAHGYGLEVTKPNLHLVPDRYIRLQTLVNRERFTTQELRDLEYDIRRAQTDSAEIEKDLFAALCSQVYTFVPILKQAAQVLAELDGYLSFAAAAVKYQYVRPQLIDSRDMVVVGGRHPVVEAQIQAAGNGQFIANDTVLTDAETLWVITGPNMGGKSTFLRQSALMVVMAQAGSFVPASSAQLPIFDRIFTRIGASDHVAQGKSTFWVEMEETALLCNEATARSLVILDEVGRGTSTYDGLAIAQAVLEYIYTHIKARCLFATHYHELTELTALHPGIVAYHAVSKKTATGIILLHQIRKGCAPGSFGIEVARGAQLPAPVIARAQEILNQLLADAPTNPHAAFPALLAQHSFLPASISPEQEQQFHKLVDQLSGVNCDELSPRQAFDLVWKLKQVIE